MGDNVTASTPNEERRPLLSPTFTPITSRTHSRSASYGTYLPQFNSLDLNYLNRLLPSPESLTEPRSLEISPKEVALCPQESFYTSGKRRSLEPPAEEDCPSNQSSLTPPHLSPQNPSSSSNKKSRHRHKDSVIESEVLFNDVYFLNEVEKQLLSLFDYISFHLDSIKTSLDQFQRIKLSNNNNRHFFYPANSILSPQHSSINEDMEDKASMRDEDLDSDTTSIGGDSGILDDHFTTPNGFLSRIREVVESLRVSLETTVRQLDEMVGLYDERTGGNLGRSTLSRHNDRRGSLEEQIKSSLRQIDTELEEYRKKEIEDTQIAFFQQKALKEGIGCNGLMAFILLLVTLIFISFLGGAHPTDTWVIVLRLLRSPLTIVLFMFLFGFNIMVWARFKIDYIRIFSFPLSSTPTPKTMFNLGAMFTIIFAFLSTFCIISDWYKLLDITDKTVSLLMWVVLFIFLLNPFKVFYRSGRFALVLVIARILIAPLPIVKFGDFWLADQFNSMVPLLLDFQYTLCYCSMGQSWTKQSDHIPIKTCTDSGNGIRPIISCLPALWRFLQCLRCYQRTKKIAHLINAVKYFTTFPVVIFSLIFALKVSTANFSFKQLEQHLNQNSWIVLGWFISSLIHALYTFFWDIKMDWGLFCFPQRTLLRPRLFYPKWIYFVAIIFDFIVRFACAIKLTLAIVYHIDLDIIYFGLIIAELLRRWVWNFFRIEYEEILRSSKL